VGFDFEAAFGHPVKLINDAAMQALGSYKGGKMLFLGLGTGLGSTMIVDGIIEPMGTWPSTLQKTYLRGLHRTARLGTHDVATCVCLVAALEPHDVVLGGGNVRHLNELPPGCRAGDNANVFLGGFRLWEKSGAQWRCNGSIRQGKDPNSQK
jgi:predicted NBD/HSP70 family sugar kinase